MAEAEDVIGRASGVGVVLDDAQIGLVRAMVQAVEHMTVLTALPGLLVLHLLAALALATL